MGAAAAPIAIIGGSLLGGAGKIIEATSQSKALKKEAKQLDRKAGSTRATSQRSANEELRQSRLVGSRALALAAASGAGASDPTVMNLIASIAGEGQYRSLTELYNGNTEAVGYEDQADANRRAAKAVKTAGYVGAGATILGGVGTAFGGSR